MKKKSLFVFFLLFNTVFLNAQTLTDVARSKELTWYGIDFTQTRFLNFNSIPKAEFLVEEYNNLIKKSFRGKIIQPDLTTSERRNSMLDCSTLVSNGSYEINAEIIKKVVEEFDIKGTGYGMLYIAESFENTRNRGFIWVVYVKNENKEIIASTRYIGYFKNGAWQEAIKSVIKASGKYLTAYK